MKLDMYSGATSVTPEERPWEVGLGSTIPPRSEWGYPTIGREIVLMDNLPTGSETDLHHETGTMSQQD
jgi:hypothetical protein